MPVCVARLFSASARDWAGMSRVSTVVEAGTCAVEGDEWKRPRAPAQVSSRSNLRWLRNFECPIFQHRTQYTTHSHRGTAITRLRQPCALQQKPNGTGDELMQCTGRCRQ